MRHNCIENVGKMQSYPQGGTVCGCNNCDLGAISSQHTARVMSPIFCRMRWPSLCSAMIAASKRRRKRVSLTDLPSRSLVRAITTCTSRLSSTCDVNLPI